jgi:hypothetical protein
MKRHDVRCCCFGKCRILGLHLERLSDIALTPVEKGSGQPLCYAREIVGGLELRNVFFRYSETEPFVLENVNLQINPGEFLTITGPSGGGKNHTNKTDGGLVGAYERRSPSRWIAALHNGRACIPRASCRRYARGSLHQSGRPARGDGITLRRAHLGRRHRRHDHGPRASGRCRARGLPPRRTARPYRLSRWLGPLMGPRDRRGADGFSPAMEGSCEQPPSAPTVSVL